MTKEFPQEIIAANEVESPEVKDREVESGPEVMRQEFLNKLREGLAVEHLTVNQLKNLVDRVGETFTVSTDSGVRKIIPGMANEVVGSWDIEGLDKKDDPRGMPVYLNLRGVDKDYGVRTRNFTQICTQAVIGTGVMLDGTQSKDVYKKISDFGVTHQDIYDAVLEVEKQTEALQQEDRDEYSRGVLRTYLKDWKPSHLNTYEKLRELIRFAPKIKDLRISQLANEASSFEFNANYDKLDNIKKYEDVFHFFRSLDDNLGREVGDMRVDEIEKILDIDFQNTVDGIINRGKK